MVNKDVFKLIVKNTPLISIDFLIKKENKYLLGKRINKPAKDYYFTIGGRIFKNETIENAKKRILKDEIGYELKHDKAHFLGVFEHFYDDSVFGDEISTHYINLAYELKINDLKEILKAQHSEYIWLSKEEILTRDNVHKYVKNYFKI